MLIYYVTGKVVLKGAERETDKYREVKVMKTRGRIYVWCRLNYSNIYNSKTTTE